VLLPIELKERRRCSLSLFRVPSLFSLILLRFKTGLRLRQGASTRVELPVPVFSPPPTLSVSVNSLWWRCSRVSTFRTQIREQQLFVFLIFIMFSSKKRYTLKIWTVKCDY